MQVSVIIPAYNSAAWLERAFASVLLQQGVTYEVIIVDNNSTDGTAVVMAELQARHPRLVRLSRATRQGSAAARNEGLRLAKGTWIQFLDADDVLLPGKFIRQLGLVDNATEWVIGACIRRDTAGNDTISPLNEDPWKGLVHNGGVGHTNSNLIRRTLLEKLGGQDENLPNGVDTDLYFRLLRAGARVVFDHQPSAIYLDRAGYRLSELPGSTSRQRMVHLIGQVIGYLQTDRPRYFAEQEGFFRAALVKAIRVLATQNLEEAKACFRQYFPGGLPLKTLDTSILPRFVQLYPVLGFGPTESMRLVLRKLLPASLRKSIKGV